MWKYILLALVLTFEIPTGLYGQSLLEEGRKRFEKVDLTPAAIMLMEQLNHENVIDFASQDAPKMSSKCFEWCFRNAKRDVSGYVIVRNLNVTGDVNLVEASIDFSLEFQNCEFDRLLLYQSKVKTLSFIDSSFKSVNSKNAYVDGNLRFQYSEKYVQEMQAADMDFSSATIKGDIQIENANFGDVVFNGCETRNDFTVFESKFRSLHLNRATVNGETKFLDAVIANSPTVPSLSMEFLTTKRVVVESSELKGGLNLSRGQIEEVRIVATQLGNKANNAISKEIVQDAAKLARNLPAGATVLLCDGLRCQFLAIGELGKETDMSVMGVISLNASKIGVFGCYCKCLGHSGIAMLVNGSKVGLFESTSHYTGYLTARHSNFERFSLGKDSRFYGGIDLHQSKIAGNLMMNEISVEGKVDLSSTTVGRVAANEIQIDGSKLSLNGEKKRTILSMKFASIERGATLFDSSFKEGMIELGPLKTDGVVGFSGSSFSGNSIEAYRIAASDLSFEGAKLVNSKIQIAETEILSDLSIAKATQDKQSKIEIFGTRTNSYSDYSPNSKDEIVDLSNISEFKYEKLERSNDDAKARLNWIRSSQAEFTTHPYEELADYFANSGMESKANEVRYAMIDDRPMDCFEFSYWYRLLMRCVGYGYKPGLALVSSIIFIFIGSFLYREENMIYMGDSESENPKFNALAFSCDVFIPLTDFFQAAYWQPKNEKWFLRFFVWLQVVAGLVLTSIFAAAMAGIVKV